MIFFSSFFSVFFFNDPATTEIYTLSLHDALPIPIARAGADGAADDDGRIARLHRDVAALAAARLDPVDRGDRAAMRLARKADGPVVLLRAVDAIGPLIVGAHVIELRGRLVVDRRPRLRAIERD